MKLLEIIQNILSKFDLMLSREMVNLGRERIINTKNKMDSVRLSILELIAYEINNNKTEGSVAEVGVYRGEFAYRLNNCFKDKTLYLFDTFEGFDKKDVDAENTKFTSKFNDFSDTSIDVVLRKMKYPNNCIVKKGYFPQTADGIDEKFCFVSLDADLFDPIYSGLEYFYPRLSNGGFIFVHDYNNINYPGAKAAVLKFSQQYNIPFVPICDGWGTAIFAK